MSHFTVAVATFCFGGWPFYIDLRPPFLFRWSGTAAVDATKPEKTRDVEGIIARPVAYRSELPNILKRPELLADSGSSQHVYNNINMLWDGR